MKERPILFSGPMVRAILEGRKTQTRRLVKPQPSYVIDFQCRTYQPALVDRHGEMYPGPEVFGFYNEEHGWKCPYGAPGDRLWVRETWAPMLGGGIVYAADYSPERLKEKDGHGFWKPSIFCRREASRLTLEIVSVRVERLQDITEADAIAEGCSDSMMVDGVPMWCSAVEKYGELWDTINGPGSWAANPWVWVVEFKRVEVKA